MIVDKLSSESEPMSLRKSGLNSLPWQLLSRTMATKVEMRKSDGGVLAIFQLKLATLAYLV